jgi:acetoacetyl-CoA synthetase
MVEKKMDRMLWEPTQDQVEKANLTRFMRRVSERHGLVFSDYHEFYSWSIRHCDTFWGEVWDFCDIRASRRFDRVIERADPMWQSRWFPGSQLNFAENLLRDDDDRPAIIYWGEDAVREELTYRELQHQVAQLARRLREMGLKPGDRVVGLLPNTPQAVVAMLASTSLGAVWASCSPDFGVPGVVDRFGQIGPTILFTSENYRFKGANFELAAKAREAVTQLPTINHVVVVTEKASGSIIGSVERPSWHRFSDLIADENSTSIEFEQTAFDHPLYVMFSSGTTGRPKCIVHSVGGTLIEHLKELFLHTDLRRDDRIFYATTCGWMMWNWLVSSLAAGATILLYDGAPGLRHMQILFDFAEQEEATIFGTSAAFISAMRKAGLRPTETHRLSKLRTILSTGSPLVPECFDYIHSDVKSEVQVCSISGGTDIIGCFALGCPIIPVYRGELQTRSLGYSVEVFDERGRATVEQKGELVCTAPFPSMPIGFWNDPDRRLFRDTYFSSFDGVWRHGDFACLTANQGLILYGRSDAVLNPGGVRIGTAEIYRQLETIEAVECSVVVDQQWNGDTRIVLFVKLRPGYELNKDLRDHIASHIRERASPRHVPKKIVQVADIPITRNGKISELAVKNVIHGLPVSNQSALANPTALSYFENRRELLN